MGKPESPHPGRRAWSVERVKVRWVKELRIQQESAAWRELDEEEISEEKEEKEERKVEKKERKEGGRQEIEKKNKDK